jgi:hypothetical protein
LAPSSSLNLFRNFREIFQKKLLVASAVSTPISVTNPAEFMTAFVTSHVIAASIFFNCTFAFGTIFGIYNNPIRSFRIIFTFLFPFFHHITVFYSKSHQFTNNLPAGAWDSFEQIKHSLNPQLQGTFQSRLVSA